MLEAVAKASKNGTGGKARTRVSCNKERREHQADDIVDEESGEHARDGDRRGEQLHRGVCEPRHVRRHQPEEARQPQVGDDDHHAEQQDQCPIIDGFCCAWQWHHAAENHRGCTNNGDAGAVEAERA